MAFTLDTYAHVMPGRQPVAAQLFSDLVFGSEAVDGHGAHDDTADEEANPEEDDQ